MYLTRPKAPVLRVVRQRRAGDPNGDGKNDAILVSRKGQLFVFENGPTTAAWKALKPRTLWTERAESPTLCGAIDRFGLNPSDIRAYDKSGLKWVNETP